MYEAARADVEQSEGLLVITLYGDLDDGDVLEEASACCSEPTKATTIVDVRNVSHCPTRLLGWFLQLKRHAAARGHTFVVRGPLQPPLTRLFAVTGTAEHFGLTPDSTDVDQAL
ncbi:STAS domain-containing protein [Streptomyces sp. NPDC046716]|uniref:STAS domain-containing protein n=1 Tax=Streptomyces sp. NPDC046716 TaxID=3157093 RepID=UPI003406F800